MVSISLDVHMWEGEDDYLIEATTKPKEEDPTYQSWKDENNMIMS